MAMQRAVSEQGVLPANSLGSELSGLYRVTMTLPPTDTDTNTEATANGRAGNAPSRRTQLQLLAEVKDQEVKLAMLTPQGLRLFVVTAAGTSAEQLQVTIDRQAALDDRMETLARLLIKDFQRAYWPVAAFYAIPTRVVEAENPESSSSRMNQMTPINLSRQVWDGERLVATVRYQTLPGQEQKQDQGQQQEQAVAIVTQQLLDYTITFTPLDVQYQDVQ